MRSVESGRGWALTATVTATRTETRVQFGKIGHSLQRKPNKTLPGEQRRTAYLLPTNQKVGSSNLSGRTTKINHLTSTPTCYPDRYWAVNLVGLITHVVFLRGADRCVSQQLLSARSRSRSTWAQGFHQMEGEAAMKLRVAFYGNPNRLNSW
jgi:hypothetical protein